MIIIAMNKENANAVLGKLNWDNKRSLYYFSEVCFKEARERIKEKIYEKYTHVSNSKNKVFFYCYEEWDIVATVNTLLKNC
ncbi:MAG: hypothetical protein ACLTBV_31780 [Enterocloster bolteae]